MTAPTIDFDAVFEDIAARVLRDEEERNNPPLVRLWDGEWALRGVVTHEIEASFRWVDNETGEGTLTLPIESYLAEWAVNVDNRPNTTIHITVDKDGARWSGRMNKLSVVYEDGLTVVRMSFLHDYEELKHVLVWPNPFLMAEIQFPKIWILFGDIRWALKTTLFCNLLRLNASLWMLPTNPINSGGWGSLDQSNWAMVVAPEIAGVNDRATVGGIVYSRMKNMHETGKKAMKDGQLSWVCRRYLPGDPPPWPGANLRYGTLVWDIEDKSGWNTGTSSRGSLFNGLLYELINIGSDGINENVEMLDDPNIPGIYKQPGVRGTDPSMPGVIFRHGEGVGVQMSEWTHEPATAIQTVAGGHSMPGVNEIISATIQMIGDLTAAIPFVPPLGGIADAILRPLYTDVFLAFGAWKSPQRAQRLGWSHYWENWAEGADKAYTLSYVMAQRAAMWASRETNHCTINVSDAGPWRIGQNGLGDFFLGDRIGFVIPGMPTGRIYVEQVSELTLGWSRTAAAGWRIQVGQRIPEDPLVRAWEEFQEFMGLIQDLGVM